LTEHNDLITPLLRRAPRLGLALGRHLLGPALTMGVPNHCGAAEKSQQSHKYFLQYSKFASERAQIPPWGRQTCFSPRAPSNLVTPLGLGYGLVVMGWSGSLKCELVTSLEDMNSSQLRPLVVAEKHESWCADLTVVAVILHVVDEIVKLQMKLIENGRKYASVPCKGTCGLERIISTVQKLRFSTSSKFLMLKRLIDHISGIVLISTLI